MLLDETLTNLIDSIYDAALNPERWTDVLEAVAEFVGGEASGVFSVDLDNRCIKAHHHFGFDERYTNLYWETYWEFDPTTALPLFGVEEVVSIANFLPYEDFREGRFYREWAKPQGWVDSATAVLAKSGTGCTYLTVVRGEADGFVDDDVRRRMALLVPHIRRSMLVGKVIDLRQHQASTFADVLDGLSSAMFLVSATGHIVHENDAGCDLLAAGDMLRAKSGQLVARDPKVNQSLREIFLAAAEGGAAGIVGKGIAFPLLSADGEHYIAHVLPLNPGGRIHAGLAFSAAAALFVRKATLEMTSLPEVIGRTYKLTPAELRVLLAIFDVGGVPEVATSLGVADTTIKTHLGRLFEKTGTGRQADLVKLVAGYMTPLAG